MHKKMILALAVFVSAIAACGPVDSTPKPLTDKQSVRLTKELSGKVAGEAVNCISDFNGANVIRISDDILLYRVSGRLVYKNTLRGGCPGLANDNDVIVTEQFGSQKCRGDLIKLVDRTTGIQGPVCSLGEFVPYRKNKTAG
ncbi:DUF6491 family protein [Sphingorhabdus profundilacus]|nr:DUF6491 family protein [Sphingorhabdus profundilacus]